MTSQDLEKRLKKLPRKCAKILRKALEENDQARETLHSVLAEKRKFEEKEQLRG